MRVVYPYFSIFTLFHSVLGNAVGKNNTSLTETSLQTDVPKFKVFIKNLHRDVENLFQPNKIQANHQVSEQEKLEAIRFFEKNSDQDYKKIIDLVESNYAATETNSDITNFDFLKNFNNGTDVASEITKIGNNFENNETNCKFLWLAAKLAQYEPGHDPSCLNKFLYLMDKILKDQCFESGFLKDDAKNDKTAYNLVSVRTLKGEQVTYMGNGRMGMIEDPKREKIEPEGYVFIIIWILVAVAVFIWLTFYFL